jgi:D-2-hydroxyglutarate dehydrogenase
VLSVCRDTSVVSCEAGVILENLEKTLHENQLTIPIDLGAKGSCHIGGNVRMLWCCESCFPLTF